MNKKEIIEKLFGFTEATFYNWKKEKRPILDLIKYFEEEELVEFLQTGKIKRLEKNEKVDNTLHEHLVFHATQKINAIPNNFGFGKKKFWLSEFIKVLNKSNAKNKNEFFEEINQIETKFWQSENWKKLTNDFINKNLSESELQAIIKNKKNVIEALK